MNYTELLIALGLMIGLTILYFLLRKFIAWAIEDKDQWNKKHGKWGANKKEKATQRTLAYYELTGGYMLFMFVLLLYIVTLFMDM